MQIGRATTSAEFNLAPPLPPVQATLVAREGAVNGGMR
jgi:hypothetical protein